MAVGVIYGLLTVTCAVLALSWHNMLSVTVNEDLAAVEGIPVARTRVSFVLLLANVIAVGTKIVGMLLVISLLIIPTAAARRLSSTPEQMAVTAALLGALSVVLGLFGSLKWDVPAGPTIVVVASLLFILVMAWPRAST